MKNNKNILDLWDITIEELSETVENNPSLRGMILGYLAEIKVHSYFTNNPHVTNMRKDNDHDRTKKGDLVISYKGYEFKIEVKSLQTATIKGHSNGKFTGKFQCDASDKRTIVLRDGSLFKTTCLKFGEFDILAVNLFQFQNKWDYGFILNENLPSSNYKKYPTTVRKQLIKSLIPISWPLQRPFQSNPFVLLDELVQRKEC